MTRSNATRFLPRCVAAQQAVACRAALLLLAILTAALGQGVCQACPFCPALGPPLTEEMAAAPYVVFASAEDAPEGLRGCRVVRAFRGELPAGLGAVLALPEASVDGPAAPQGALLLLWPTETDSAGLATAWKQLVVDETSLVYLHRAPGLRVKAEERLAYFAKFLEHPAPLIAEDAFREFAQARFEIVQAAAAQTDSYALRGWLADPNVLGERKGLYGLLLGLADDPEERSANLEALRAEVLRPADDFRAGYDGVLAGYLLAGGEAALAELETSLLDRTDAPTGDVRHLQAALRFCMEYEVALPRDRLLVAVRKLLQRTDLAAVVTIDLARWKDWDALPQVLAAWTDSGEQAPAVQRAICGYLLLCPAPAAAERLEELQANYAQRIAEARTLLRDAAPAQ